MKALIQHTGTRLYLSKGGKWVSHPRSALAFLDEVRARDYCIYRRLAQTIIVVAPEAESVEGEAEVKAAAPSLENKPPIEIETMKPKAVQKTATPKAKAPVAKVPLASPAKSEAKPAASAAKVPVVSPKAEKPVVAPVPVSPKPTKTVSAPVPPVKPVAAPAPAPVQASPKPVKTVPSLAPVATRVAQEVVTTVEARVDVGFGNALFIRGQGNGLSWDQGQPLTCAGPSTWVFSTKNAREGLVFKLLINDQLWSQGEDLTVAAGQKVEVAPVF